MIRALSIAVFIECIIILFLIFQPSPKELPLKGFPSVEVVSLSSDLIPDLSSKAEDPGESEESESVEVIAPPQIKQAQTLNPLPEAPVTPAAKVAAAKVTSANPTKVQAPAAGPPTQPVSGDRLDAGVVLLSGNNPVYPKHAAAYNIETEVKVKILVGVDGVVQSVTPITGEDKWGFSTAVRNAVMNWRFQPGLVSGYSASFYIIKSFKFNLD